MNKTLFDDDTPAVVQRTIPEIIKQRRAQMLVHSCIYYELNDNIVSDHLWQKWADELQELQEKYPEHKNIGFYDNYFQDWTGATGNHLPHRDPWVMRKALYLLGRRNAELC
jgi:NAD-dependent DNA ligase